MVESYSKIPSKATLKLSSFKVNIPDSAIATLKNALKLSTIAPVTFEGSQEDRKYGVSRDWILKAKAEWETKFDWREHEARVNRFPHWKTDVPSGHGDEKLSIHFMALFSDNPNAIPLLVSHGWPGSFLEFVPIFELLTAKYTPATLPYHIIAPSLTGYGFSGPPPHDREFAVTDVTVVFNNLMIGLGFGSGYVAHGGDVGSVISRFLAIWHDNCKAAHVTLASNIPEPEGFDRSTLTQAEKKGLARTAKFGSDGTAYMGVHRTRPSTIGLALSSSPIALLAWVGEKYLDWTDQDPPITEILTLVSLYWFTNSISTTLYPYRSRTKVVKPTGNPRLYISKPFGFSQFPEELSVVPKSWIETSGNLVFYRVHEKGGHFASLEVPEVLLKDVEDFTQQVWNSPALKNARAKL